MGEDSQVRDGKDPHHIIQSFSWGLCKKCALQHVCQLFVLLTLIPRAGAAQPSPWGAVPQPHSFDCQERVFTVLFCSQKWLYKREPFNFTYIFPGYQNCIYLFQWLRHTCTISIPVTSAEQIQSKRSWLLFPNVRGQQSWCLSLCIYSGATA